MIRHLRIVALLMAILSVALLVDALGLAAGSLLAGLTLALLVEPQRGGRS
jgi:hypothetical protein